MLKKSNLVKVLANGKLDHTINIKVDKASKNAIKIVKDKKGNIAFYSDEKKPSKKEEKTKTVKKETTS